MSLDHVDQWRYQQHYEGDGVTALSVAKLKVTRSFRVVVSDARVKELMAAPHDWRPIIVARADHTIIDGRHRVIAARRLGRTEIAAEIFDGEPQDAFIEFVRRNVHSSHGLERGERQKAARRILCSHPDWADRRIGELCGISPKTVAKLRCRIGETFTEGEIGLADVRVGRDGRARPVDPAARRAQIVAALAEQPNASLRVIARAVGASPETVRSVRASLGQPGAAAPVVSTPSTIVEPLPARPVVNEIKPWEPDQSFTSRDDGMSTAEFLMQTDVCTADIERLVASVPLSRVYEVADEARQRAMFWSKLADRVEARSRRR